MATNWNILICLLPFIDRIAASWLPFVVLMKTSDSRRCSHLVTDRKPMSKEERSPRVTVSLPEGSIDKLDRYANVMKTKQASAAAYLLQSKLDEMERNGEIPRQNLAGISEEEFNQFKEFISLLLGDRTERNGVSFVLLGQLLGLEAERISELYQLVKDCREGHAKGKVKR